MKGAVKEEDRQVSWGYRRFGCRKIKSATQSRKADRCCIGMTFRRHALRGLTKRLLLQKRMDRSTYLQLAAATSRR